MISKTIATSWTGVIQISRPLVIGRIYNKRQTNRLRSSVVIDERTDERGGWYPDSPETTYLGPPDPRTVFDPSIQVWWTRFTFLFNYSRNIYCTSPCYEGAYLGWWDPSLLTIGNYWLIAVKYDSYQIKWLQPNVSWPQEHG